MSPLANLAGHVASDPHFLAHHLAAHQLAAGQSDADLAERLGCDSDTLTRLRLCRTPANVDEVRQIAERFGCDASVLAGVLGVR